MYTEARARNYLAPRDSWHFDNTPQARRFVAHSVAAIVSIAIFIHHVRVVRNHEFTIDLFRKEHLVSPDVTCVTWTTATVSYYPPLQSNPAFGGELFIVLMTRFNYVSNSIQNIHSEAHADEIPDPNEGL